METASFFLFSAEIKNVFEHAFARRCAPRWLFALSQGNCTAAEYALEFCALASETHGNSDALSVAFHHGMADRVKNELVCMDHFPKMIWSHLCDWLSKSTTGFKTRAASRDFRVQHQEAPYPNYHLRMRSLWNLVASGFPRVREIAACNREDTSIVERRDTSVLSVLSCWETPVVTRGWGDTESVYSPNQVFHKAESSGCWWPVGSGAVRFLTFNHARESPRIHYPLHSLLNPFSHGYPWLSLHSPQFSWATASLLSLGDLCFVVIPLSSPGYVQNTITCARSLTSRELPFCSHKGFCTVSSTSSLETCHQKRNCSPSLRQSPQP